MYDYYSVLKTSVEPTAVSIASSGVFSQKLMIQFIQITWTCLLPSLQLESVLSTRVNVLNYPWLALPTVV
jgi:hypothetical protein